MNVIIFSKNRPMQLHALLESIELFWPSHPILNIIYEYETEEQQIGYQKCLSFFDVVGINGNNNFKTALISLISPNNYTMFLNDSCLFNRQYQDKLYYFNNNEIISISNSLGFNISVHEGNPPTTNIFNHKNYKNHFNNIYNFNGSIYKTFNIIKTITQTNYNNKDELLKKLYLYAEINNNCNLIYMNDIPCVILVNYNNIDQTKFYVSGQIIDIYPFMYEIRDTIISNNDIFYTWRN